MINSIINIDTLTYNFSELFTIDDSNGNNNTQQQSPTRFITCTRIPQVNLNSRWL